MPGGDKLSERELFTHISESSAAFGKIINYFLLREQPAYEKNTKLERGGFIYTVVMFVQRESDRQNACQKQGLRT